MSSDGVGIDLSSERAAVVGGAGTIGSTVVDQLLAAGSPEIVVLDNLVRGRLANLGSALRSGRVRVVEGDIRDQSVVDGVVDGSGVVFHLAAIRITQCAEDPRLALEVLADGTFNVLDAARRLGVKKVIASSSASVYGAATVFPTPEDHHPYGNRTMYGAAKAFNEGMLRSFTEMYGLPYVALRYFNVYGERMDVHGVYTEVLVRWMERIDAGQPPVIFGAGSQTMDFVHVHDIARANLLAASAAVCDEVFNVGSGRETSLAELATALLAAMGSDLEPEHGPERGAGAVPRRQAATRAAEEQLGFRAEVGLDEGLRRLVRWWRAERAAGTAPSTSQVAR